METVKIIYKVEKYTSYKDSGTDWIGEIPISWNSERLSSILNYVSERNRTDLPLLSITREKGVIQRNIDNEEENHNFIPDDLSNYKVLRKGQFGMNKMKAWQGSYGISKHDGIVSPAYFIFKLRDDIDTRYFHLAIRSQLYISFFGSASDGVRIGQWDLSKNRMKNIPFLIPPKEEQIAIAAFLDSKTVLIDQAIKLKQKLIEFLKERRQILIHNAVTRGLNANAKMKASGVDWIGEIPENWKVKKLKHCIEKKIDNRGRTPAFGSVGIPMLEVNNITDGDDSPNLQFNKFVLAEVLTKYERDKVKIGDLLISTVGATSGKVVIIKETPNYFICQNVVGLRMNDFLLPKFACYAIGSLYFKTSLMLINKGNTIDNLKVSVFINNIIFTPPTPEQKQIVEYIEISNNKITTAISLKEQEIEKLKEYKNTLINSAVTGKIKVC